MIPRTLALIALTLAVAAGQESGGFILNPVSWSEGDWNGDGVFDSSDMVAAFADGGYEQGPRTDAVEAPEPGAWLTLLTAVSLLILRRRG